MKRNPTLEEKKALSRLGLDPKAWLVKKHTIEGMVIINKHTGTPKTVPSDVIK